MTRVGIESERTLHERGEPIMAATEIDRAGGQIDLRARGERQHERRAATSSPR